MTEIGHDLPVTCSPKLSFKGLDGSESSRQFLLLGDSVEKHTPRMKDRFPRKKETVTVALESAISTWITSRFPSTNLG